MASTITFDCTQLSVPLFLYISQNNNYSARYYIAPGTIAVKTSGTAQYDWSKLYAGIAGTTDEISGASYEYSTDNKNWTVGNKATYSNAFDISDIVYLYDSSNTTTSKKVNSFYPSADNWRVHSVDFGVRNRTIYFKDSSDTATNVKAKTIISALEEPASASHLITFTLPDHTTASISSPYKIEDGQSTSFTVSPASGYKITDLSASVNGVALGVSQLTTGSWTITTGEVTADEEIVITATVVEDLITITVNTDVDSNVTVEGSTASITRGSDFSLEWYVSTTEEYDKIISSVDTTPTIEPNDELLYNSSVEPIGVKYTFKNLRQDTTIDLTAKQTDFSYSVTITDSTSFQDIVISHTPEAIAHLEGAQTITVTVGSTTSSSSYRFTDAPPAETASGGLITGVLSTNKQTASYSIPEDNTEDITITLEDDNLETFTPAPLTEDYPHFTFVYLPTSGQVETIANSVWLSNSGVVDLITYANRYEQIFDIITSDKTREMYLGSIDIGIQVAYIEDRVFTRDLGTVSIEEYFHDADDYVSTTIRLYVPLYGYVDLDPSDVMGHSVGISYKYEVDSGRALAMVYCDYLDPKTILWQGAVNFAIEEPIGSIGQSSYTSSYWTILTQQLGELKPYIIITRKNPATDILDVKGRRGQKVVKVSDVTGFVKFDTIFLTGIEASLTELNEIASYLKTGVLVN